jgi:hypothetical protein
VGRQGYIKREFFNVEIGGNNVSPQQRILQKKCSQIRYKNKKLTHEIFPALMLKAL